MVWVLVISGSEFTIDPEEDITSPTPDSEPSQTPRCVDITPEPIADRESVPAAMEDSAPAAMEKPAQEEANEQTITPEPKSHNATRCVSRQHHVPGGSYCGV